MIFTQKSISSNYLKESADVIVVGSGAGGAVLAKELQEGGMDVVLFEEGGYYTREKYAVHPLEVFRLMYREGGATSTIGTPPIPIPLGRCVGGTTAVNSGTTLRADEKIFLEWKRNFGIKDLDGKRMEKLYERVEKIIQAQPVNWNVMGKNGEIIDKGCKKLGWKGKPIVRNYDEKLCRGCGRCAFGCPTDAKRATHLTYIPMASEKGARIYANCRVQKIEVKNGKAKGVSGCILEEGTDRVIGRFEADSKIVAFCGGALITPWFLLKNRLANSSGQVGRNLTIHPAARVGALFDEKIEMWKGVPQNYLIEEFKDMGIIFEGVTVPPAVGAMAFPYFGHRHKYIMENYDRISTFGIMVSDKPSGRVVNFAGRPLYIYNLGKEEAELIKEGIVRLAEIYFAAGAKVVYPGIFGIDELKSMDELKKLREMKVKPSMIESMAFHPLGTCRMGEDPKNSVVNSECETHDVKNLYIVDGSVIPTSLGANPQLTIMAIATHVAFRILEKRNSLL